MNVAINGFGRIGRAAFKILLEKKDVKIVAINDLTDTKTLSHLLKFDSVYGRYEKEINSDEGHILVNNKKYAVYSEKDPANLPWKELKVDVVLECTGIFRTKETASLHLKAGAKKVIISAPAKSKSIKTLVVGVNEQKLKKTDNLLSNASCTTNCLAPVSDIVRQNFGIENAIMTTVHSYTANQNIVDGPHKDLRRARSAAINIVPTTTGAAKATALTIPQLKGKFDGMAIRVPIPVGSLCDIVFVTKKKVNVDLVNRVFKKSAKQAKYKYILKASSDALVSSDIVGSPMSSIVDLESTKVVGDKLLKIIAWYDNEWGYSNRLVDLALLIKKKKFV